MPCHAMSSLMLIDMAPDLNFMMSLVNQFSCHWRKKLFCLWILSSSMA